jgi:hypothetical protein
MAANLLDDPQRDACVAHLSESRSPKTVGGAPSMPTRLQASLRRRAAESLVMCRQ